MNPQDTALLLDRLEKLEVKDGDILVFKGSSPSDRSFIQSLAHHFQEGAPKDVRIIMLSPGMSIETMDESQLAQIGLKSKRLFPDKTPVGSRG